METPSQLLENSSAMKILASEITREVESRGGKLIITDELKTNLSKTAQWLTSSSKRGLLLSGSVGNGKTTLARAVVRLLNAYYKTQNTGVFAEPFKEVSAYDLSAYARDDKEKYTLYKNTLRLYIDDVGVEESGVKNYGNIICPFAEVLFERYAKNRVTIITTNLTLEQIENKYDVRIADRICDMFERINFTEKSFRR